MKQTLKRMFWEVLYKNITVFLGRSDVMRLLFRAKKREPNFKPTRIFNFSQKLLPTWINMWAWVTTQVRVPTLNYMEDKFIKIINSISKKVDKGTEDVKEMAGIVTSILNDRDEKFAELAHELTEAYLEIEKLEEENDIMRSDLSVILDYMKKNNINMTYVVKFREKEKEVQ